MSDRSACDSRFARTNAPRRGPVSLFRTINSRPAIESTVCCRSASRSHVLLLVLLITLVTLDSVVPEPPQDAPQNAPAWTGRTTQSGTSLCSDGLNYTRNRARTTRSVTWMMDVQKVDLYRRFHLMTSRCQASFHSVTKTFDSISVATLAPCLLHLVYSPSTPSYHTLFGRASIDTAWL